MAVGPEIFEQEFIADCDRFEKLIDIMLKAKSTNIKTHSNAIYVNAPPGMIGEVFTSLRRKYIKAGWLDVKYHSDQPDGNIILFIKAKLSKI